MDYFPNIDLYFDEMVGHINVNVWMENGTIFQNNSTTEEV